MRKPKLLPSDSTGISTNSKDAYGGEVGEEDITDDQDSRLSQKHTYDKNYGGK